MQEKRLCLSALFGSLMISTLMAQTPKLTQTKLVVLETKITHLRQDLVEVAHKQNVLTQDLKTREKTLAQCKKKLQILEYDLHAKARKLSYLKQHEDRLTQSLKIQETLLAKQLRLLHHMNTRESNQCLLNQEGFFPLAKLLTLQRYLLMSRQERIIQLQSKKAQLKQTQDTLAMSMTKEKKLQLYFKIQQERLDKSKAQEERLLLSLGTEIQAKKHQLGALEENKKASPPLLNKLTTKAPLNRFPSNLTKGLVKPVQTNRYRLDNHHQALILFAKEGSPVYAAASGKIVFSDWFNGYGLLVIIQHSQGLMTLYAHNKRLLKTKGSLVQKGEEISKVGRSNSQQASLYFEIRKNGKPIPPLKMLSFR